MFKKFSSMPMSKKLIVFLFINVLVIEVVAMFATIHNTLLIAETGITPDYTPLNTLIQAAITQVIAFAVYSAKSSMEKLSLNKNGLRINEDDEVERIEDVFDTEDEMLG